MNDHEKSTKKFYVYIYRDIETNNPLYIGKGCGQRMYTHINNIKNGKNTSNNHWSNKLRKLINDDKTPIIEVFKNNLSTSEALSLEENLIAKYGRKHQDENGILYNTCSKSNDCSGIKRSEETLQKMANANIGKILSEETKKKISIKGKGRKHTTEAKLKMSKNRSGLPVSEETKIKISESWKNGKRNLDEYKRKQREAQLGKKDKPETFINKSLAQSGENNPRAKTWKLKSPEGNVIEIKSFTSWCKENNLSLHKIHKNTENNVQNDWVILDRF